LCHAMCVNAGEMEWLLRLFGPIFWIGNERDSMGINPVVCDANNKGVAKR